MPKTIYLPEDAKYSGIDITWTKSSQSLSIGGWYDSCVGIQSSSVKLAEFFARLGITEADCRKAFRSLPNVPAHPTTAERGANNLRQPPLPADDSTNTKSAAK